MSLTLDEVMTPLDAPAGSGVAGPRSSTRGENQGEGALTRPADPRGSTLGAAAEAAEAARSSKRELVQALANRVAYGINRAITMTPVGLVAASLLAHVQRGLPAEEVARRVELLRYIAGDAGARFSRGLAGAPSDPRLPGPVADAVTRLAQEGLVRIERAAGETIYQVVEERRTLLDYHKNAVIHRYVSVALIATALRASGRDAPVLDAPAEDVKARTRWLSRLLKLEFMYRVGASFDELFEENAAFLRRLGIIEESAGRLRAGAERGTLEFLAGLLRPYLEGYGVVAEALLELDRARPGTPVDRQGLAKAAMERGRAAYASGRLALRESLSKATFENAAEWLVQQGALEPEGGPTRLAAAWRDGRLPETIRQIRDCLGA